MSYISYTLKAEPRGLVYRALLDQARTHCNEALLVIREPESSVKAVAASGRLGTFEIRREMAAEWPGTLLLAGGSALVVHYRLEEACVATLCELADGLFDWLEPNLPEDLCLIRPDGTPWLITIAHERDAYLKLTEAECSDLLGAMPELSASLQKD